MYRVWQKYDGANPVPSYSLIMAAQTVEGTYCVVHLIFYQYEEIMGYTGDILLIHGTKDKIVNIDYAKRANEMYKANGANIRFEIIEGGGHMFSRKYDVIAIQMLMRG